MCVCRLIVVVIILLFSVLLCVPFQFITTWPIFVVSCFVSFPVFIHMTFFMSGFVSLPIYHSHNLFLWCLALCPFNFIIHMICICGALLFVLFLPVERSHGLLLWSLVLCSFQLIFHIDCFVVFCLCTVPFQFVVQSACFCGLLLCIHLQFIIHMACF